MTKQVERYRKLQNTAKVQWASTLLAQLQTSRSAAIARGQWQEKESQILEDRLHALEQNAKTKLRLFDFAAAFETMVELSGLTTYSTNISLLEEGAESLSVAQNILNSRLESSRATTIRDYETALVQDIQLWEMRYLRIESTFHGTNQSIEQKQWTPALDDHVEKLEMFLAEMHDERVLHSVMDTVLARWHFLRRAYCRGTPSIPHARLNAQCQNMFANEVCEFECDGNFVPLAPLRCSFGSFVTSATGCFRPE